MVIYYSSDEEFWGPRGENAPQPVTQPDHAMVEDRHEMLTPSTSVTERTDVAMLPASSEPASEMDVSNLAPTQEFAAGAGAGSNLVPASAPVPTDEPPMIKMDVDLNVTEHDKTLESKVPSEPPLEETSADLQAEVATPTFLGATVQSESSNVETEVVSHPVAMQVEPTFSPVNGGIVQNSGEEKDSDGLGSSQLSSKEALNENHVDEGQSNHMAVVYDNLTGFTASKINIDEGATDNTAHMEIQQISQMKGLENNVAVADSGRPAGWSMAPSGGNGVDALSAQTEVNVANANKTDFDEVKETQQSPEVKELEDNGVEEASHTPLGPVQNNSIVHATPSSPAANTTISTTVRTSPPHQPASPPAANTTLSTAERTSPSNRPASPPRGFLRELRVEDALNYLDQVKVEFGSAPRIYNEFLEIMKHFKAHEIDTPGVIMRVSELFSGYNNLILGFNTFLPEGYQISLKDLQEGGKYCRPPRRPETE